MATVVVLMVVGGDSGDCGGLGGDSGDCSGDGGDDGGVGGG